MRSPRTFMLFSLAGLAAVAALASWYDRGRALHSAEDQVEATVSLLRKHAQNVFQTQALVHEKIRLRTAGLDREDISCSGELASFLRETRNRMSQISSIWLADTTGHVRASSERLATSPIVIRAVDPPSPVMLKPAASPSRAISISISASICFDTATSAVRNVT
jgi:hypothetical protein